ncbi:MAG: 16S rRNA (guanine(527)-N(7))-methyltransferase RsmG [Actinomycetia bacterium]|nr:16S rRNA (guanine(527)-N(7))-methyltransferase RsmG [Actinomycetes bacterium]
MRLLCLDRYAAHDRDGKVAAGLSVLGDLILGAGFNVSGIDDPGEVERRHFLDSLSLLDLEPVLAAGSLVDIGSGAGLPALVLGLALPEMQISALESRHKKCSFIETAARTLGLSNVTVLCARAEDHGQGAGRGAYDVAVSRALASLPVVAEYSLPLLRLGGTMVAMKGSVSDQECIEASRAAGILGADGLDEIRLHPFVGAENRWAYVAVKTRPTPAEYPRRPGVPSKRPLGGEAGSADSSPDGRL